MEGRMAHNFRVLVLYCSNPIKEVLWA
jgi:hypothetical protein